MWFRVRHRGERLLSGILGEIRDANEYTDSGLISLARANAKIIYETRTHIVFRHTGLLRNGQVPTLLELSDVTAVGTLLPRSPAALACRRAL